MKNKIELIDYLKSIRSDLKDYFAIHFHFSLLDESNKSEYKIKIASNILNAFFRNHLVNLFLIDNYDLIIIYRHQDETILKKVIFELRYLFIDDSLSFLENEQENPEFCTSYNLSENWIMLFDKFSENYRKYNNEIKPVIDLNIASLSLIENDIININITPSIRAQNIAILIDNKKPKIMFQELYISISHLANLFDYQVKMSSDPLLFRYITSKLDERMLLILKNNIDIYFKGSISINLNISTILSDKFESFDKLIKDSQKNSIIIELNISDVFLDISAFISAKRYLQNLGYKVCLDGLNNISFVELNRESLGFDLVKLQWNSNEFYNLSNEYNIKDSINKCGAHRVVLCRCDNIEAIEYGRALGISLFQGWYIDQLINM